MPLPINALLAAFVKLITPDPVTVKFVAEEANTLPLCAKVQVPEPKSKVRVALPVIEILALVNVTLYDAALKVPFAKVNPVLLELLNASANVTDPDGELIATAAVNVFPALVIVWLPLPENIIIEVPDNVMPVPLIQLP